MEFDWVGVASSGEALLNIDLRATTFATLNDETYLFAVNGANGGLTSFRLRSDGGLAERVDHGYFAGNFSLGGIAEIIESQGNTRLVVGGGAGSPLMAFDIDETGAVGGLSGLATLDASTMRFSSVVHVDLEGADALYAVDAGTDQLRIMTLAESGMFEGHGSPTGFDVSGIAILDHATVAQTKYLIAADSIENEIIAYRVDAETGALQQTSQLGMTDGLGMQTPNAMETVSAFGKSFVIVASSGSHSLSVLELGFDGQLEAVDHVLDTGETRFGAVQAMSTSQVGDRVFVVAGGGDDGLSLFVLLPDGRLSHVQTLVHQDQLGLQNIDVIETVIVGQTLQILVGSDAQDSLSQFRVDLQSLGTEKRNWAAGDQFVQGSVGDDILMAGLNGHDTLNGRGGDDILVATHASVTLNGGAGRDRFVFADTTNVQTVEDFEVGVDTLDLSAVPFLRSPDQVVVRSLATGAELFFGDVQIRIFSADGQSLGRSDLFADAFDHPDRVLVLSTPSGIELTGSDGSEQLVGSIGDDTIFGNGGDDVLNGWDANDVLIGGAGNDVLSGQNGDDILIDHEGGNALYGGAGHDSILGGQGFDTVYGGAGEDSIDTQSGDDSIGAGDGDDFVSSGAGNDTIWAGHGNDRVESGDGDDSIGAFSGNDTIDTGLGNDTVWASDGHDLVVAGPGDDQIGGFTGNDTIFGDAGNDELWGAMGADAINGGTGNDLLGGFTGSDTLRGDAGQDNLWGGDGDDRLYGGNDDDHLLGGGGADRLLGDAGDDHIWGDKGSDQMWGGDGADVFYFYKNQGADRIRDFEIGLDKIRILDPSLNFADLEIIQQSNAVQISLGKGTIRFDGLLLGDLTADDFLFG